MKDKSINPADLPQSEVFEGKEINQHKHLADMGKPIENEKMDNDLKGKPGNKTSKKEGLNQAKSAGTEGLEHQSDI